MVSITNRAVLKFIVAAALTCAVVKAEAGERATAASSAEIDRLFKDSLPKRSSKTGRQYEDKFLKAIDPVLLPAMTACTKSTPDTVEPGSVLFVIGADGRVKQFLWSKDIPMAQCVAEKLRSITTLPKPPEDNWVDGMGLANHSAEERRRKNAPKDTPIQLRSENDLTKYDTAIAPYVAKARATYPEAKRRFLTGLPKGYDFLVRVSLFDGQGHREDCLIEVEKIRGGKITGRINAVDMLKNYQRNQEITFPEAKIDNWLIVRPDGTEEGNYVGKFLDKYNKPQKR